MPIYIGLYSQMPSLLHEWLLPIFRVPHMYLGINAIYFGSPIHIWVLNYYCADYICIWISLLIHVPLHLWLLPHVNHVSTRINLQPFISILHVSILRIELTTHALEFINLPVYEFAVLLLSLLHIVIDYTYMSCLMPWQSLWPDFWPHVYIYICVSIYCLVSQFYIYIYTHMCVNVPANCFPSHVCAYMPMFAYCLLLHIYTYTCGWDSWFLYHICAYMFMFAYCLLSHECNYTCGWSYWFLSHICAHMSMFAY